MHVGEALQHRDEAAVLALRDLEVDDVVVEVVFARAGGDRDQFLPWSMNEDRPQGTDFRRDVHSRHAEN